VKNIPKKMIKFDVLVAGVLEAKKSYNKGVMEAIDF